MLSTRIESSTWTDKDQRITARLNGIFDTFVERAGWTTPRSFAYTARSRYSTPPSVGRLGKNDLEPRILVQTTLLTLQMKKLKVSIDANFLTERLSWYMKGPVDQIKREWVLEDEDIDLLDLLEELDPDLPAARNADDSKMRAWPYVRSIEGVTYKKSEKNKRMGAKGEAPEYRSSPRPVFGHHESSGGGTKRCPKGSRRVAGECLQRHGPN